MLRGIVGWSLKFRFLVVVIAAAVIAFGIVQLRNMPVDVLPEFSPPYVEIQTEALGLSAEEVEQMITVPMEQDLLAGVAWLDVIRSESVPGLSSVVIYFEPGTDPAILTIADLPIGIAICFEVAEDAIVHDERGADYLPYVRTWSTDLRYAHRVTEHALWDSREGLTAVVAVGREAINSHAQALVSCLVHRCAGSRCLSRRKTSWASAACCKYPIGKCNRPNSIKSP